MLYRVVYKHWSEINKNVVLVEADIEAVRFEVTDGNLVFFGANAPPSNYANPILAVPAGLWVGVEPADALHPTQLITKP